MRADGSNGKNGLVRDEEHGEQLAPLLGVIGDPIGHTLSPVIHTLFAARSSTAIGGYWPFEVRRENLEDAVRGAHALGIRGMNVTVPHKSAVIPLLSGIDPLAARIGAVNTLVYEEEGYRGYNTDATGLKRALEEAGVKLEGAHAVILGAGGAARAVAFLCAMEGTAEISVINRTRERAEALCSEVNDKVRNCARTVSLPEWIHMQERKRAAGGEKAIAFQCTSVGLYPKAEESVTEDPAFFENLFFAVDIVYRPIMTKFLRSAGKAGVPTLGGLSMLLYQAADAFSLWFPGKKLSPPALRYVLRVLQIQLRGYAGIHLIGFMGSGKTTVGRALAERLHYDLWDTDQMIEEGCGKSVSRIFAEEGETAFRELEMKTLQKIGEILDSPWEGETDGLVLSTGGGLPMREENRRWLKKGAVRVVYLRVRPETVVDRLGNDTTRPLLAGADEAEKRARVEKLMAERDPVYEECADLIVDADEKTPDEIALEIMTGLSA